MKFTKKEIFSIPNMMGYFRILLLPFIVWRFLEEDYITAAVLIAVSGLTDLLDGKVARKFNMVTELGKMLDPVADKLTLGTLILCLAVNHELIRYVAVLYVIKEGFMGIMGLLLLAKKGKKLDGAMWFGKVCTAVSYGVMLLIFLFPDMPEKPAIALILLCASVMAFTLGSYIPVFIRMWKEEKQQ